MRARWLAGRIRIDYPDAINESNRVLCFKPDTITPQIQAGLTQARSSGVVRARSLLIAFFSMAGFLLVLLFDLLDLADSLVEILIHGLRERGLGEAELFGFVLGLRAGGVGGDLAGSGAMRRRGWAEEREAPPQVHGAKNKDDR